MTYQKADPVLVRLDDLRSGNVDLKRLEKAFGPESLGIIVVSGLPEKFIGLRQRLLSFASHLGNLSQLDGSHAEKRSYQMIKEGLLVGFKETFEEFCVMVIDIAGLVARACDRYALKHISGYQEGYLEHVVKTSTSTKARLLHYFPPPALETGSIETEEDLDNWCGTHLDHGCLTGLTSAMYVDEGSLTLDISRGVDLPELESAPDPDAGLYIKDRKGGVAKVGIPRDCLAFQTGEALEVITKGKLKAVPHFVRGCRAGKAAGVSRNTIAVFTQPNLWEKVDGDRDFATFAKEIVAKNTEG
ncbi:unnamed protein product [Tuber melanosporum]|uniref:(Perigord truffle) hypothetical protein n=1 Tax=Tuber melanosporum (strain Mel28) TaxID=656061 RepID=D5G5C7_TUBMM|nr:uncharacterized protein GSTUM_00004271001 [Tuber melanosporum]CAZ79720.1 unnamed protein product [Tuber melanosporum]